MAGLCYPIFYELVHGHKHHILPPHPRSTLKSEYPEVESHEEANQQCKTSLTGIYVNIAGKHKHLNTLEILVTSIGME